MKPMMNPAVRRKNQVIVLGRVSYKKNMPKLVINATTGTATSSAAKPPVTAVACRNCFMLELWFVDDLVRVPFFPRFAENTFDWSYPRRRSENISC